MEPGSVVQVLACTKHWHGAKADSWFSHIAFLTPGEDVTNEWLEAVTDEAYTQLPLR
ncbi:cupin [Nocardia salmonicida]|uniref:cupin n=1 Tax=Nocardia salmonicida TaxID=53431 RepID=UPI003425E4B8